ncbi:hypothetical protein C8A01DRAFT_34627 [Parachaetomium inaequale]|uniref:Uncharacterized protein n=1 Tax=Parachaetomium inaequale TaxID=2588326 RepID=A0AAN6PLJ7_9PEZI|nr:hypothetical protein C8A01DRAFT_34627 [Parachaetomium inaequale]
MSDAPDQAVVPNHIGGMDNNLPGTDFVTGATASLTATLNEHDAHINSLRDERDGFRAQVEALEGDLDGCRYRLHAVENELQACRTQIKQLRASVARIPAPQPETEAPRKRKADEMGSDMGENSPRRMSFSSGHPLPSGRHPLPSGRPPLPPGPAPMPPGFAPLPSMLAPVPAANPPDSMTWAAPYGPPPPAPVGPPPDIPRKNLRVWWQFLANERWSASKEIPAPKDAPCPSGDHGWGVVYNIANPPGDFMTTFSLAAGPGTAMIAHPDIVERVLRTLAGQHSREDHPDARWWLYMGKSRIPLQRDTTHLHAHPLAVAEEMTRLVTKKQRPAGVRWWVIVGTAAPGTRGNGPFVRPFVEPFVAGPLSEGQDEVLKSVEGEDSQEAN